MNFPHPDEIYESLMELARHPSKRRNLEAIHRICRERYDSGVHSFASSHVERQLVSEGVLSPKTLGNAKSEDYRTLISAWGTYSKLRNPSLANDRQDWLQNIPDPAVRQLVQLTKAELHKLRGEVIVLRKLQGFITVRTGTAKELDDKNELDRIDSFRPLLPTERASLSQAVDPTYLLQRGLTVGPRGEILQKNGAVLFERGFIEGLKKILGKK